MRDMRGEKIFRSRQEPLLKLLQKPAKPACRQAGSKEPKFFRVPKRPGNWKKITAIFVATATVSLLFYLKTEVKNLWRKINSPVVVLETTKGKPVFNPSPILKEIEKLTENLQGEYGIYVESLIDGHRYGVNEDKIAPAASLMKMPVIITLYQQAEKGSIDLGSKYELTNNDKVSGAGFLQSKNAGTLWSYQELAELMGKYSDNTAYMVLRKILGDGKIQETIVSLGMKNTSLKEHTTTPEDMGILFKKIYDREEILGLITKTIFEAWMPVGIPQVVRVAHKIGKDLGTFSDGGIIFGPKPFILVIMSKNANEKEANDVLPKIAKAVWEFEETR